MIKSTENIGPKTLRKKMKRKVVAGKRKSASRQRKKPPRRDLPPGLFYLVSIGIAVLFLYFFYAFFIRPYSYRWKPCYGVKSYGVCMPAGDYVHGMDLSHYQGEIDWRRLDDARTGSFPIRFIFMKASEGGDLEDKTFKANFDSARAHGFIRGAYHFYNLKTDPRRQADFFIRHVELDSLDLPPVLDIEQKPEDRARFESDVKVWLRRIEAYYGVKPIIYASYRYKTKYLNDSVFDAYPYWIAHYYVDSVAYKGAWKFWQHTDVGTLPGIEEKVDLNVFNGTWEELMAMTVRRRP